MELPINNDTLSQLQQKDMFCNNILAQIEKGNIIEGHVYVIKDKLLKRYVIDRDNTYETTVLPRALTARVLWMAHDKLGHNGTHRMYTLLKRLYYWKGLKPSVAKHIKMCYQCQRRNKQVVKYATLHFNVATVPMQFISMDLIGEFHAPTTKRNRYALTVICMLTGYVFCIPLKTKTTEEVLQAYIDNIYSKFGGLMKILSDNGTEFKNKIFEQIAKKLGVVHKLYTPPYHPASNGRIEGFHAFLKACIAKHIAPQLEWDDLVPLACVAYNFIPNELLCKAIAILDPFFFYISSRVICTCYLFLHIAYTSLIFRFASLCSLRQHLSLSTSIDNRLNLLYIYITFIHNCTSYRFTISIYECLVLCHSLFIL